MQRDSRRFQAIQRLAQKKERDKAAAFGRRREERDAARRRLQELESYRQDYLDRYTRAMQAGAAVSRLRDYQGFIERLERAILEQRRLVDEQEARCREAKQDWSEEYTQVRAIGNVVEHKQAEERREEARREQKLIDDRGPRRG